MTSQPHVYPALAAQVAALGGFHSIVVGNTMSADRYSQVVQRLLPAPTFDERVRIAGMRALAGVRIMPEDTLRHPLVTVKGMAGITGVDLVGHGKTDAQWKPGYLPRAHGGVLSVLDLPELTSTAFNVLRTALIEGGLHITQGDARRELTTRFLLAGHVLPAGTHQPFDDTMARYLNRLPGYIIDRCPIRVRVFSTTDLSTVGDERTLDGPRTRMAAILSESDFTCFADVTGDWLRSPDGRPEPGATADLDRDLERGLITMRGYDQVLRLSWAIATLDGAASPTAEHIRLASAMRAPVRTLARLTSKEI